MAIDIAEALFRLNNQVLQKTEELEALNFAIVHLKGEFAPKFQELYDAKARVIQVEAEKAVIQAELDTLKGGGGVQPK